MSPMAYRHLRVAEYRGSIALKAAVLEDLRSCGRVGLDFSGAAYLDYAALLDAFLAVREAFPGIHHGTRDQGLTEPAPDPAVFFSNLPRDWQPAADDAWDKAARWFETHTAAGTACSRCGGTGRVIAERINHGCGFEDTIHGTCGRCGGVGIEG